MRGRWLTVLVIVNLCLLGYGLWQLRAYAVEGQKARTTQCQREPVIRKLVFAGAHYHLLGPADVKTFRETAPKDCPPP